MALSESLVKTFFMAGANSAQNLQTPELGDTPHQPPSNYVFPPREFGKDVKVKRSVQHAWFAKWPWLQYDEIQDCVFCFYCTKAYVEKKLTASNNIEASYVSVGYRNWKDATVNFRKHEHSKCHMEALQKIVILPSTTRDIGETLSAKHALEKQDRRACFLKLLSNVRWLARQGLPLRGHGDEVDSNFIQLLRLRREDCLQIDQWLQKKTDKYTSADVQNEMLTIMARQVANELSSNIRSTKFFTIMVDETTDVSNHEQAVICIRWVEDTYEVHEDFLRLSHIQRADASTIVEVIKDFLVRVNLPLSKARGQCYDGASTMSGAKAGVAKQIMDVEKRALYTHCYGHALNLACADTIKQCKVMKDALDTTYELTKLIKMSPRRDAIMSRIKEETSSHSPGIRVLCPTRWTVRAEAFRSVLENYMILKDVWEESLDIVKDTEMKARIIGVSTQMQKFEFFYGVSLSYLILRHTDNLSRTLQKVDISASEGQAVATMTVKTLETTRNEQSFDLFWEKVAREARVNGVDEAQVPRKRKMPRRYEDGQSAPEFPPTVKDHYRKIYFECLDLIMGCISDRFDQSGYRQYSKLQDVILKAANHQDYAEELAAICSFYGSDFDSGALETQLITFSTYFAETKGSHCPVTFPDVVKFVKQMSTAQRDLLSEISTLLQLILVMPATNAQSERSFSALRRVKSYLRATMSQERLNHLMLLHIHREVTDSLDLVRIANEFVGGSEHRLSLFGRFMST